MRPSALAPLVALLLGACSVELVDPAGRACDEAHPCAGGRVCHQGLCVPTLPPTDDAGEVSDAGSVPDGGAQDAGGGDAGDGDAGTQGAGFEDAGTEDAGTPDAGVDAGTCAGAPIGDPCTVGQGACAATGTLLCVNDMAACSAIAGQPSAEVCDGADNDCNGIVDDVAGCFYTVAGDGPPGFRDGASEAARLAKPGFITAGPDGALYWADTRNHALRRADPSGNVTTIAGGTGGTCGYLDGPAASALLCDPFGVSFGPTGALYFGEWNGNRLRKLENGVVTTVAGSGTWGHLDGPATQARFQALAGLRALPNGDVLIADVYGNRIRQYRAATNDVVTVAGAGSAGNINSTRLATQLTSPTDVELGSDGTLYVSEVDAHRIRRLPVSGDATVLAGSATGQKGFVEGIGTSARFGWPGQLTLDEAAGTIFVADANNHRVRGVPLGGTTSTFPEAGGASWGFRNGAASSAQFDWLWAATRHNGVWYLVDLNNVIRKSPATGSFSSSVVEDFVGVKAGAGAVKDGPAHQALLDHPHGLSVAADGRLYWVEQRHQMLRSLGAGGQVQTLVGTPGGPAGHVDGPLSSARFNYPARTAVGPDGAVYVADEWTHTIRRVRLDTGMVDTFAGPTFYAEGHVDGSLSQARFYRPVALAFGKDALGQDALYVADSGNRVIRKIAWPNGPVTTVAGTPGVSGTADGAPGTGQLTFPRSLTVGAGGTLFVGDQRALRQVSATGVLSTPIADTGRDVNCVAMDGAQVLFLHSRKLSTYDPSTGAVSVIFDLKDGYTDGTLFTALAFRLETVVVTPQAYWMTDTGGGRLRRLWR
jgi:hypothetical protein